MPCRLYTYRSLRASRMLSMLLISTVFSWSFLGAQEVDSIYLDLEWKVGRPLTWDDYRLKVFKSNRGQLAITSVKHSVRGELNNEIPDFEVKVIFVVNDSWTTDKTDTLLLAHEQLHFDIGELFRRKIVKRINGLRKQGEKQKAIYRYVIRKELSEFRNYSKNYDKSTKHGVLKAEQKKWEMIVWEELKRLQ